MLDNDTIITKGLMKNETILTAQIKTGQCRVGEGISGCGSGEGVLRWVAGGP